MYPIVSVHLPFQSIDNCRDLGGIRTRDGRAVRPGKLIRSASLEKASMLDLQTLDEMGIDHIIDLRTDWEIARHPDRLLREWQVVHLPVLHASALTKQEGGKLKTLEDFARNTGKSLTDLYPLLVLNPHAVLMWRKFFRTLIDHPGSWFFHCTQGKDRTGTAAILLLTAFGVDEETIRNDYLQTNLYMEVPASAQKFVNRYFPRHEQTLDADLDSYYCAAPAYWEALNAAVVRHYGSWQNYLTEALGLSDKDLETLRTEYLTEVE
ncbi:MAG: tyrosine-protein phosphatase [Erysipelotrichaceae bacterium]|nr:tyrosine-protein phosphatase [Erysipelotrichaceae bacterium]